MLLQEISPSEIISESDKASMHNIRPAGQLWPVETFNMAGTTPNFVYFACHFEKNTFLMCYKISTFALGYVKKIVWPALRFELWTSAIKCIANLY